MSPNIPPPSPLLPVPSSRIRTLVAAVLAASLALAIASCGGSDDDDPGASVAPTSVATDTSTPPAAGGATTTPAPLTGTVRLGFFPNVTHAPALVGVAEGFFSGALGPDVQLDTFTFNAGTEAIEALFGGSLDITFIGPNPAINGFAKSDGKGLRIIAGSTSGGAFLVTRPEITSAEQLRGTTLATPSLGNTQDVALRAWLADNGLQTSPDGGGDVTILPQSNAATLESFVNGDIDGAWVPEPWATRLVEEGGGKVLVDERTLWPQTDGEYVTTHVIVRTEFLEEQPQLVRAFLQGLIEAQQFIADDRATAESDVIAQIASITGQDPDPAVVTASFDNLTFTLDPIAASLQGSAEQAQEVGLLDEVDLTGIYDLSILNDLLRERGQPEVQGL
jgi:NitT/TauT family transport system substrate-binding protein